jgi:hypothetical protein
MSARSLLPIVLLLATLPAAAATLTTGRPVELTTPVFEPKALTRPIGRIAGNDAGFLAVFLVSDGDSTGVFADRLDPSGAPLELTAPLFLGGDVGPFIELAPDVAAGDDGLYLTAWSTPGGIRARTVTVDGVLGQPIALSNGYDRSQVHVAFNGDVFLVLWDQGGATISPSGQVISRFRVPWFGSNGAQVLAIGGTFQVLFHYGSSIVAIAITAQGSVSPLVTVAPAPAGARLHAVARGEELIMAWTSFQENSDDSTVHVWRRTPAKSEEIAVIPGRWAIGLTAKLLFTRTPDGKMYVRPLDSSSDATVAKPNYANILMGVASNANGTVTLFADTNYLYSCVLESGTVHPLVYAPRDQGPPGAAAAAGGLRLAVWSENRPATPGSGVRAARFDADGSLLDPLGIAIFYYASFSAPRVVSDGTNWLAMFNDGRNLYASRVAANGTLPNSSPIQIGDNFEASGFDVAWDGSAYMATWTSHGDPQDGFSVIQTMRIKPSGERRPTVRLTDYGYGRDPAIAAAPEASLVVWTDRNLLQGVLLSPSGTAVPLYFPDPYGASSPTVAFNGSNFLVAWQTAQKTIQWVVVSTTGVFTNPPWNTLAVDAPVKPLLSPQGSDFLLAYAKPQVHLALLSGNGYLLVPPNPVPVTGNFSIAGSHLVYAAPTPDPVPTHRITIAPIVRNGSLLPKRRAAGR